MESGPNTSTLHTNFPVRSIHLSYIAAPSIVLLLTGQPVIISCQLLYSAYTVDMESRGFPCCCRHSCPAGAAPEEQVAGGMTPQTEDSPTKTFPPSYDRVCAPKPRGLLSASLQVAR